MILATVYGYVPSNADREVNKLTYHLQITAIVTFVTFAFTIITRYMRHPALLKKNLLEFPNSSYMGAIPISINSIMIGIVSYYDYRASGVWAAFVVWWIGLFFGLCVTIGVVIIQMIRAAEQELSDVAGVWVMTTVPLLTTASSGATLLPFLSTHSTKCAIIVLVISFMCWALGMAILNLILSVYFYRLIAYKLPAQPLLASSFLPIAALSQGAFAIQKMSIYLASYIQSKGYGPTQVHPPPIPMSTLQATQEVIHWMGIIMCLYLLAHATFWLVQAVTAILFKVPKSFNIGMWSFVFPLASYANAWSFLSRDLRNDGMRGWAAMITMLATITWLFCALCTTYFGLYQGSLFNAPGLEEWIGDPDQEGKKGRKAHQSNGTYSMGEPDEEKGETNGFNADGIDGQDHSAARRRAS